MEKSGCPSGIFCKLCGEAFTLPEGDVDGNLPRVLLCGHIYCTVCLQSMQCDNAITCPECEVESPIPEGEVSCLQEDSRIIGLIYTNKMNKIKRLKNRRKNKLPSTMDTSTDDMEQPADIEKIEKVVDAALAQAAENLAQLEHIRESLCARLTEHWKREEARLEKEMKQATDKAYSSIQKWKEAQLNQLTKQCAQFSSSHPAVCHVQEKIKNLQIAIQMAREVRRVPFLEEYCILDKVLETLQAPVDKLHFNVKFTTMGCGVSCVIQSEIQNQSLALSLKMETCSPKPVSESSSYQARSSNKKTPWKCADVRNSGYIPPSHNRPPQKQEQSGPGANSVSSHPFPKPRPRSKLKHTLNSPGVGSPDVIVEEVFDEGQEHALPPTGPELASDKWRIHRRRRNQFGKRNNGTQVVVTHIVNPCHFYIHYLTEKGESEALSKKINHLCCGDNYRFTSSDTMETGSVIFAKRKDGLWCRASVVEIVQSSCEEAVKTCPVSQLARVQVFFVDFGFTETFTIQSEEGTAEASLNDVNSHLRKVDTAVNADLSQFAPQAIRCSLKDLVPYDLTKGWSEEARHEFQSVVGSAAVVMRLFGQDQDSLLVDLRKPPMDQSSDVPFSVREYLVLIEVARFYSPVTLGRAPLLYYSPVYPKINTEVDGMVTHINNPADFYIQLVGNTEYLLLSAKLQDCYSTATVLGEDELNIYCPEIGQACVARCDGKLWCRAQVTDHPDRLKVEVRFVDLGSKKILSVNNLRKIKDEFFALPAMAINCCLSDVIPLDGKTWTEACVKRFMSLADQKLVTIIATEMVRKADPLPVKLLEGDLKKPQFNISEQLVKENLASFKDGLKSNNGQPSDNDFAIWDPPLDHDSSTEGIDGNDQTISGDQNGESLEPQPQLKFPAQLKDLKVRVTHVNSPNSFYVLFTHCSSQLKRICEQVKQECALLEPQDVVWKAGMYCAAVINGVWERGQICSDVLSEDVAEVRRCDHGNTVKLHVSNLRPLPPSLIGSLAFECTLNNIRPAGGRSTWTDTACDLMSHYLTGASAVMTIQELTDERPIPVTLFCSNKMGQLVSIANFLASEGLALKERKPREAVVQQSQETDAQPEETETQTDDKKRTQTTFSSASPVSTLVPRKPAPRTIMSAEKVTTQPYHPPELPCPGHIPARVSAVGDDGVIYVRTHSAEYQLEQLKQRIHQTIKTLPKQKPYTWKTVIGCAIMGSDMSWYRGQLLEVLGGNVKVQYVDYGYVENLPVVHVHPMLLCDDVPQLSIPCQLLGINPIGGKWQEDAVGLLRELLLNRSVDLQVVTLPPEPRGPLTVELFLDGLSLNKILCHHEHATMDPTVSTQKALSVVSHANVLDDWDLNTEGLKDQEEPILGPFVEPDLPRTGENFEVRVKHLCTPNELYLWPVDESDDVEVDGETLDEALSRVNADIDNLKQLDSFPLGGPCLAEYSDGMYYRAKLMKFISMEPVMILVQHVDFGSDDTVPPSKLRQMPAHLLQFPSQALKVKVAGFKPPSVNRQEDVLPYSPRWSMKATREMLELLHGNITAVVVARKPELKVQLFNEDGNLVHLPLVSRGLAEFE